MKFCKCQKLNSLFREINFLRLPKYSWDMQMLGIIEKLKKHFEKYLKNWYAFLQAKLKNWHVGTPSWKIGTPLARWHAKLNNCHAFGMGDVKMRSWHVLDKLTRGRVNYAGTHSTWFSNLFLLFHTFPWLSLSFPCP